jgi:hypothetical protein
MALAGSGGLRVLRWNCRSATGTSLSVERARGTASKVALDAEWLPVAAAPSEFVWVLRGCLPLSPPPLASVSLPPVTAAPVGSKSIAVAARREGARTGQPRRCTGRVRATTTLTVWPYWDMTYKKIRWRAHGPTADPLLITPRRHRVMETAVAGYGGDPAAYLRGDSLQVAPCSHTPLPSLPRWRQAGYVRPLQTTLNRGTRSSR